MKNQIAGKVSKIETMGLVDGPGVRTVVFLQGCPLRCLYCHNPEMQETFGKSDSYQAKDIVKIVKRYLPYYKKEGGVTFSGGEPLLQKEFLLETLKECKKEGINTCLDTSGIGSGYEEILDYVDLVILDVKACDKKLYNYITGGDFSLFLKFLETCQRKGKKMWLRQVIVPGINDNEESVKTLKKFASSLKNIQRIELLPYHSMAKEKYKQLGRNYPLAKTPEMDKKRCEELEKLLK